MQKVPWQHRQSSCCATFDAPFSEPGPSPRQNALPCTFRGHKPGKEGDNISSARKRVISPEHYATAPHCERIKAHFSEPNVADMQSVSTVNPLPNVSSGIDKLPASILTWSAFLKTTEDVYWINRHCTGGTAPSPGDKNIPLMSS